VRVMAGADKRAKLLSGLLAAKGGASGDAGQLAEPEHASVIQITKRRLGEDRASEASPAPAPSVLYNKGAATASTFRPSYWSFDHEEHAKPTAEPASVEPAPPPPPVATAPVAQTHPQARKPLPVNLVVGFGCLALVVSTTFFVLSFWHRAEPPAIPPEPAKIATATTPAAAVLPLPQPPPAETPAPSPAPTAPAPAPAAASPALAVEAAAPPQQAAVATVPVPAAPAPAPVASDPPPTPAVTAPPAAAAVEPAPAAAAAPTAGSNPQAAALLARGDDLLATGDVAAARLFYQRAAEQGSAAAATAVGQTYDPAVLGLLRVRGARGDPQMAAEWYRKAIAAGDRQAEIRLKRLLARAPG
jgi:hypothetical protein